MPKYRWIEDTIQSVELPFGDVLTVWKGKEFDLPDGGGEWIARACQFGKAEEVGAETVSADEMFPVVLEGTDAPFDVGTDSPLDVGTDSGEGLADAP